MTAACSMEMGGLPEVKSGDAGLEIVGPPAAATPPLEPIAAPDAGVPTSPDAEAAGEPPPDAELPAPSMWDAGVTADADGTPHDLVLYLRFDDLPGAAMARDDSGLAQHVTLHQIDASHSWVPGKVGGALALDADKFNWVSMDDAGTLNRCGGELTFASWLYPTEMAAGPVISRPTTAAAGYLYVIEITPEGHLRVTVNAGAEPPAVLDGPLIAKNKWSHIAVTVGRGQVRIFLDGVPMLAQQYRAQIPADSTPLLLGTADPKAKRNRFFSGRLDELTLYSRVIEDADIAALARGASATSY